MAFWAKNNGNYNVKPQTLIDSPASETFRLATQHHLRVLVTNFFFSQSHERVQLKVIGTNNPTRSDWWYGIGSKAFS